MEAYIDTLSRYIIPVWMIFYTLESFSVFRKKDEESRKGIYNRQLFFMFLVHLTCFLAMYVRTGNLQYLFFYAFQQLALFMFIMLFIMLYPDGNRLLLQNACMLLTVSFVVITRLNFGKAVRQSVMAFFGMVLMLLIPHFAHEFHKIKKIHLFLALAGALALSAVLLLGSITNGSKISYTVLGVTFQPSEFVKILFVIFLAGALSASESIKELIYVTAASALYVLILTVSKDLGSALIFFVVYIFMVFLATGNLFFLLAGALGGSTFSVLAYYIFPHIQVRVQAWKDPWSVINGQGYQISQSLFAMGRGGLFGLGLMKGAAYKIPYVEQDFIFSAVAEELGLIFAFCLILICLSTFLMLMDLAFQMHDRFFRLTVFGSGILYAFQVFLTIGGDTKFIPLTGVTLPLVSYGGSSLVTTLILFGMMEGMFRLHQEELEMRKIPHVRRQKIQKGRALRKQPGENRGSMADADMEMIDFSGEDLHGARRR